MLRLQFMVLIGLALSFFSINSHALLFSIDQKNKASIAVQRSATGDLVLLLEKSGNPHLSEYIVYPDPVGLGSIVLPGAEPIVSLSIEYKEVGGGDGSKNTSIVDSGENRTQQRINISQDLRRFAQAGQLRDGNGKVYAAEEIKWISLHYVIANSEKTESSSATFQLSSVPSDSVQMLAGEPIRTVLVDPIELKINQIEKLRAQELPIASVRMNIQKALAEINYSSEEAQVLVDEILGSENRSISTADILRRHETAKDRILKLINWGLNSRLSECLALVTTKN